jgi:hypothetical protein
MGEQTSGVEASHRSKFVIGIISHSLSGCTRAHTDETITFKGLRL